MSRITYSIIGAGWRSEFYLRIAKLIPDKFCVACICTRNEERAKEIAKRFDVKIVRTIDELKTIPCDFIVNCINKNDISELSFKLAEEGFAVLAETPACVSREHADCLLKRYKDNYKIQVAEQFHLKPMYQAIKRIIDKGIIGEPYFVNMSVAHDYHGMSLIRFFLNTDTEPICNTSPVKFLDYGCASPILHTHFRNGELENKEIKTSEHTIKVFGFIGKTAIYDFEPEQYFSPIRTDRLLIRGDRGEIENDIIRYFNKNNEFVESKIVQHKSGNLDGLYSGNITFENKVIYKSQFGDARITDEETAIAEVLIKMKEYVECGKQFYSFKRAVEDAVYFI